MKVKLVVSQVLSLYWS